MKPERPLGSRQRPCQAIYFQVRKIKEITIRPLPGSAVESYSEDRLRQSDYLEDTDEMVRVATSCPLEPKRKMEVSSVVQTIQHSNSIYPLTVSNSTVNISLTLVHPEGLIVRAIPLHPSTHAFQTTLVGTKISTYRPSATALPYQERSRGHADEAHMRQTDRNGGRSA